MSSFSRKRKREAVVRQDAERTARADENPWLTAELADEPPTAEQTAQYSAWADRMHQKRAAAQASINGDPAEPAPTYWTTDNLYRESERVEAEEVATRPNPWQVRELLAVLDLRENATADEVGSAYKRLAKLHHPDHFAEADETTRSFHDDRMRAINAAYRSLRTLELT